MEPTVVALFNAISKRQNQGGASAGGAGGGSSGNNVAATAKATVVKGASRHAFLDMLKTGVKPTGGAAEAAAGAGVGSGGKRGGGSAGGGGGAVGEGDEVRGGTRGRERIHTVLLMLTADAFFFTT